MKTITTISVKKYFLTILVIFSCFSSFAQYAVDYLKAADNYFKNGDYYTAAINYEKYLNGVKGKGSESFSPYNAAGKPKQKKEEAVSREEVNYKAGESYQLLNNYVKAEPFFKEAVNNVAKLPLARYWYAKSLKSNSKFDDAETEFNKFLSEYTANDVYRDEATRELKNLQFRSAQLKKSDLRAYFINKMGINGGSGGTSAPAIVGNNFYFSSTRPENDGDAKSTYFNKIYQTELSGSGVNKLTLTQDKNEHLEATTFSPDGNKMYVTKWYSNNEKKSAAIFVCNKQNETWSDLEKVGGDINLDGYSSQQPSISADGTTLYYSSDKPGGSGGFDIWMTTLQNGKPGTSINLGTTINTSLDEYAPFYFTPGKSLVFSSNARVGMGGFDFYQSKGSGTEWAEPVNLGYPVNSVKDEIYIFGTGKKYLMDTFYFSSDRNSDCCLEMFSANKMRSKKRVKGIIINCLTGAPLPGVSVTVSQDEYNNVTLANNITDEQGKYEVLLDEYQPFRIKAEHDGFLAKEIEVTKISIKDTLIVSSRSCLEPPEKPFEAVDKPIVIDNIYFDYDSATLRPESFPVLDSVVGLMERYPTMAIEVSGHTDSKGGPEYNQKLSEARAKAFVDYVSSKGIESSRMTSKGFGASRPLAENKVKGKDNPEGRQKNRRTEIKVLHY